MKNPSAIVQDRNSLLIHPNGYTRPKKIINGEVFIFWILVVLFVGFIFKKFTK